MRTIIVRSGLPNGAKNCRKRVERPVSALMTKENLLTVSGRVTLENMEEWVAAGAFAGVVGVTTEMGLRDAVKAGDWERVAGVAGAFAGKARQVLAARRGGAAR